MASIPRPGPPFRRFRVFLSYAHEQRELAERLAYTLDGEGHDAFFDRHDLPAGQAYTARIRAGIERADLFVFLISPDSVAPGTFALTELGIAIEKARRTKGFLLGVLARPTEKIPAVLSTTTYLVPQGDVVAETANEVAKMARARRRRNVALGGAGTAAVALACAALYATSPNPGPPGRGTDSPVVADSPAEDTAVEGPAADANAPSRDELAEFHIDTGELYLSAPEWLARAQRHATRNSLAFDGDWLSGPGVSRSSTPNRGSGSITPAYGVFHFTASGDLDQTVSWMLDPDSKTSAHLVIGRDGNVVQLAPFTTSTWHVGQSASGSAQGMNRRAIGIELINWGALTRAGGGFRPAGSSRPVPGIDETAAPDVVSQRPMYWETYTEQQLFRAVQVARLLHQRYRLADFLGHFEISGNRKMDPGPAFPLPLVRLAVYGGDHYRLAAESFRRALELDPSNADAHAGLAKVVVSYVELADRALAANDRRAAEDYLARAAALAPADARVDSLRARLRAP